MTKFKIKIKQNKMLKNTIEKKTIKKMIKKNNNEKLRTKSNK